MRRFIWILIALFIWAMPVCVVSEQATQTAAFLPEGIWIVNGENEWFFMTANVLPLTDAQLLVATQKGLLAINGALPAGTLLTEAQLLLLWPGTECLLQMPRTAIVLPSGVWTLSGDGQWLYVTQSDTQLTAAQQQTAAKVGVPFSVDTGVLPLGSCLNEAQLSALYPGVDSLLSPSAQRPIIVQAPAPDQTPIIVQAPAPDQTPIIVQAPQPTSAIPVLQREANAGTGIPQNPSDKIFYLTIDDTPRETTPQMLALLDTLGIKATFFIVGAYAREHPEYVREIYARGHTIANHSYSHDADILASSFKACLNDFRRCEEAVAQALGFRLAMPILRVPYGASTIPVSYRTQLQQHGYMWIDWNALNGDTEKAIKSDKAALERAYSTADRYTGSIVMLVHDGKNRTLRTLPEMVQHFKDQGYVFDVLTPGMEKVTGARMGAAK